jgi:hypothetical protein
MRTRFIGLIGAAAILMAVVSLTSPLSISGQAPAGGAGPRRARTARQRSRRRRRL